MRTRLGILGVTAIALTLAACSAIKQPAPSIPKGHPTGNLVFYGDQTSMWACARDGQFLTYETCRKRFTPGVTLLRPVRIPGTCEMPWDPDCTRDLAKGHERVTVGSVEKEIKDEPCGDIASYEADKVEPGVGPRVRLLHWTKEVAFSTAAGVLQKKYDEEIPRLMIRNAVEIDLDGDGRPETVYDLTAGFDPNPKVDEINGPVLYSSGVWRDSERTYAPMFEYHAGYDLARYDFYAAHIYGYLAGFADADGDGVVEVLVENGYHEGNGMDIVTYKNGVITTVVTNGCGA